jgi:hypothetical protein
LRWDLAIAVVKYSNFTVFEVLTAVVMKSSVLCARTPCSPLKVNRHFGGTCRLHLQGRRIGQPRNQREAGSSGFQQTTRRYIPESRTLHKQLLLRSFVWEAENKTTRHVTYLLYVSELSHYNSVRATGDVSADFIWIFFQSAKITMFPTFEIQFKNRNHH